MRRLLATASTIGFLAACGGGDDAELARIGFAGPLDASYGAAARQGAELAIEEANARGGVRFELLTRDDGADPARAIDIASEFLDDPGIVAVVGHVNSGTTRAAAGIYNQPRRGLLAVSPTATSAELSGVGPWTFRVCATDLEHGPALAAWALGELGRRRAAVLYANDPYGRGILAAFTQAFRQGGGTVVADDPYLTALIDSVDVLRPYLERAMSEGADMLMVAGELDAARPALELARSMGFTGPMLGGDGLLGLEAELPNAERVYISTGFLPDQPGADAQRFVQAFVERFGTVPTGDAALAYDAARLLIGAIQRVGTDRQRVRDYVAGIGTSTPPFDGVTGTIAFDAQGDAIDKEVAIGTIRDGRLVSARSASTVE